MTEYIDSDKRIVVINEDSYACPNDNKSFQHVNWIAVPRHHIMPIIKFMDKLCSICELAGESCCHADRIIFGKDVGAAYEQMSDYADGMTYIKCITLTGEREVTKMADKKIMSIYQLKEDLDAGRTILTRCHYMIMDKNDAHSIYDFMTSKNISDFMLYDLNLMHAVTYIKFCLDGKFISEYNSIHTVTMLRDEWANGPFAKNNIFSYATEQELKSRLDRKAAKEQAKPVKPKEFFCWSVSFDEGDKTGIIFRTNYSENCPENLAYIKDELAKYPYYDGAHIKSITNIHMTIKTFGK